MNIQNAKELTIEEGSVRTITDTHGNQLWGKVNYSVKYGGDTTQQTYSGKNLTTFPYYHSSGRVSQGITFTVNNDGSVTLNGQNNNQGASTFYFINTSTPISAGTYYCVPTGSSVMYTMNAGSWYNFKASNNYSATIPSNTNIQEFYLEVLKGDTTVFDNFTIYPMLTTMANPTVADYEPYVGGIPAPNPDYPQTVNVVTGLQSIRISDLNGLNSNTFQLDLGTTELCKIDTYQDYIYKSGDDWYVHKEINKLVFDGSVDEEWSVQGSGTNEWFYRTPDYTIDGSILNNSQYLKSNYGSGANVTISNTEQGIFVTGGRSLRVRYGTEDTISNWKNKLSTTNMIFYYAFASTYIPTDTQITDATLVDQLEAINEWCTRYGYSFTVEGSVHILINQTTI